MTRRITGMFLLAAVPLPPAGVPPLLLPWWLPIFLEAGSPRWMPCSGAGMPIMCQEQAPAGDIFTGRHRISALRWRRHQTLVPCWLHWHQGKPVISSQGPGLFTSFGHFIVLRGVTFDGRVLVNDPNDSPAKNYASRAFDMGSEIHPTSRNYWIFER